MELMMVQKSGKLTIWGLSSLSPLFTKGFSTIQTVVGNGISGCHQQNHNMVDSCTHFLFLVIKVTTSFHQVKDDPASVPDRMAR